MKPLLGCLLFFTSLTAAEVPPFAERARRSIEFYAHPPGGRDGGYLTIAAKLYLHEDGAWCSRRLQQLLAPGPTGDMFWMFPVTAVAYLDRGQLTAEARR